MPLDTQGKSSIAKKIEAFSDGMSLHTADPGSTAAFEVSGGGYVRRGAPITATGVTASLTSPQSFNVPACTVTHVGLWQDKNSVDPATDFFGGFQLDTPKVYASPGILTVDTMTFTVTAT